MSENQTPSPNMASLQSQRMAWVVLWGAFVVFLLLCVLSAFGLQFFLFRSTIPMLSVLEVGRGTVSVTGLAISDKRELSFKDDVHTISETQATIFFRDAGIDNQVIASATLQNDTQLTLWRTARPRFGWSSDAYGIELREIEGRLDIDVPQQTDGRPILITLVAQSGAEAYINASGQYSFQANGAVLELTSYEGDGLILKATDHAVARMIPPGLVGALDINTPEEMVFLPAKRNLLKNNTFETINTDGTADQWVCTNSSSDNTAGVYRVEQYDGRSVMRFVRSGNTTTNGESRCLQSFSNGLDVSGYSTLLLRVRFRIDYQALSACGTVGSECPLMLQLDYFDADGLSENLPRGKRWLHGFYYALDPQREYPLTCDSCLQAHDRTTQGGWYTYEINWLALFPAEKRPVRLVNAQIYASGHDYEAEIGEFSVLAGK